MSFIDQAVEKLSEILGDRISDRDNFGTGDLSAYESKSYIGMLTPSSGPREKLEEMLARHKRMKPSGERDPATTYENLKDEEE